MSKFKKAEKKRGRIRMALMGPSGAGKTYTALRIAAGLGKRIAIIDTEKESALLYVNDPNPDGGVFEFDHAPLDDYSVENYMELISEACSGPYDVLIIDSLTHAWAGPGGILDFVDSKQSGGGNKFAAWRDATPKHNQLIEAILGCRCHVIATMRSKTEWVVEENDRGKKAPRKIGLAPVQRDGLEYEFDVIATCNDANLTIDKTRCRKLHDKVFRKPGKDVADILLAWMNEGPASESDDDSAAADADDLMALAEAINEANDFLNQHVKEGNLTDHNIKHLLEGAKVNRLSDLQSVEAVEAFIRSTKAFIDNKNHGKRKVTT